MNLKMMNMMLNELILFGQNLFRSDSNGESMEDY